jgi:hypothetical protein
VTADRAWDLDQLADYAAGLLDEARAAEVAAVVAADPAAAQLYAALGHADDLVRADLRDLPVISMPADVAARIDTALAAAGAAGDGQVVAAGAAVDGQVVAAGAGGAAVDGQERSGSAPSAGNVVPLRRRRWLNGAAAVAAGVAVLAGAAFGLNQLTASQPSHDNSTAASGSAPQDAKPGTMARPQSESRINEISPAVRASGTNYEKSSLAAQVGAFTRETNGYTKKPVSVPPALQQLAGGGLGKCLEALGIAASAPGLLVDYAQYDGSPALVVTMSAVNGVSVTVAGPGCGENGADLKLRTTVPAS